MQGNNFSGRELNYPSLEAGQEIQVNVTCSFVRCLESDGVLYIRDRENSAIIPLYSGTAVKFREIVSGFTVIAPEARSNVQIVICDGEYLDDRLEFETGASGTLSEIADGSAPVALVAGAATQICVANANRQEVIIRNTGSVPFYVRSDNTAQESALEVLPGAIIFLSSSNALFAYAPALGEAMVSEVSS